MAYNFDTQVDRKGTNTFKWDNMQRLFGRNDLLPFWVADMDFQSPPPVAEAMIQRAGHGVFGYTYIPDSAILAIAGWCGERYRWEVNKDWISMGNGVMSSVAFAVQAFTAPGDSIIVQSPVYYPFFSVVEKNKRKLVLNPLLENGEPGGGGGYGINFAQLEAQMKAGAKMLLLCSPHNPVGRVWSEDELNEIGRLCSRYDLLIVSDEIHADIIFSGHRHISFGSLKSEYRERAIVCMAPSKTFNLPGLAISQVIIPNPKLKREYDRFTNRCFLEIKNLFSIIATETAYREGGPWLEDLLKYLEGNIEYAVRILGEKLPKVKITKLQGTYLLWLDFRDIDEGGCGKTLIEEAKVGLNEGTIFGAPGKGFQRMNLACPRSRLKEGLERITEAFT